jgi:hypothetical protein
MLITFGQHSGKSVELVVLKNPAYVAWMLRVDHASGALAKVQRAAGRLLEIFDAKPILRSCCSPNCGNRATYCTVIRGAIGPYWWCNGCDLRRFSVRPDKLEIVRSYADAIWYANMYCNDRKKDLEVLIRALAQAKGLPERVGEVQAVAFFANCHET